MSPPGPASPPPPSPAASTRRRPAASPESAQRPLAMCPPRSLLLTAILVLLNHLDHLSVARNLPTATPGPGMFQCLNHSQNLLRTVSNTLQKNESCLASRESSFVTNGSCLTSGKASFMMTLCLSSIYEDLKMYQVEFKAMNAKLLIDPKRQIFLDQNMLAAIDELMQALNFSSETVPQKPSLEDLDFYKTKIRLCILLHAFRIRAVTINRMMSYLNSS
ncbi:interleukin-12 subunit alpha isoform X3 [Diceros bicornis minor]|uniref:interleukin-12 subunit alpha isoform X3 n=1 Tax=Diceros bicornis minor TaxID=77932 RepID=UPI0026F1BC2F|nr:interleukin-12 subunit alpha isoform X3 [Diceros bicornis minor]